MQSLGRKLVQDCSICLYELATLAGPKAIAIVDPLSLVPLVGRRFFATGKATDLLTRQAVALVESLERNAVRHRLDCGLAQCLLLGTDQFGLYVGVMLRQK